MLRKCLAIPMMLLFVIMSSPLYAGPGVPFATLGDQVDALQDSVNDMQSDVDTLQGDVDSLSTAVEGIANQLASMKHGLKVQTSVDTTVCDSVPVQCANHGYDPASSSNHNPIRLFVQVVDHSGAPVSGLSLSDFSFSNPFVPAGGGAATVCSEAVCGTDRFQSGANGLYTIFLDRGPSGNWKAGAYAGTVVVSSDGETGASMVNFSIE